MKTRHIKRGFFLISILFLISTGCSEPDKLSDATNRMHPIKPIIPTDSKILTIKSTQNFMGEFAGIKGLANQEKIGVISNSLGLNSNNFSTHTNYCNNFDYTDEWNPEGLINYHSSQKRGIRDADNSPFTISMTYENKDNDLAVFYIQFWVVYN